MNRPGELDTPHRAELLAALRRVDVRVADLVPWDLVDIDNSHDRFTFTVDEILAG